MPKLKKNHFTGLSNLFGGKEGNTLVALLNSKPDHATMDAITPLAPNADLAAAVAKINTILAALQTPSAG